MTQSAVGVPTFPESVTQKQVDCDTFTQNGIAYYRQRVQLGSGDIVQDAWGVPKVSLPKSLFHSMFTFDIPQAKWFMYHDWAQVYTSPNITAVYGAAHITSSATELEVVLESRMCPRYQPNRGHLFSTALWCPSKTANGVRDWGIGTRYNHVIFRLKGDGNLYAVVESNGVVRSEELIDTSSLTGFDVEKNNTYDIQFQWRSAGNYQFYIGDPLTGFSKHVHTLKYLGTLTSTSIENPALPVHLMCQRVTEDVAMNIGCVDITSENGGEDTLEYGSAYASNVTVNTNTPVIVLRQPLLINTKINTRDLVLARINFNCSKKAVFKVWSTRNPADLTGATYRTLGNGSYLETDSPDMDATAVRATTATVANMRFITAAAVEAAVPRSIDNPWPQSIEFPIVRGDYIVVTCTAATATADVVIEWGERV